MVKLRLKIAVLFLLALVVHASAYTVQFADKAKTLRLRWKTGTINLTLSESLKKQSPLVTATAKEGIYEALDKAMRHWQDVADVKFNITWADKTDVSPAGVRGDGASLITIADTPDNILFFDGEPNTAAKTRIFYNAKGQITEGDIVLNPYQLFSDNDTAGTFDLESVLTHELGHLLGLGHSDITGATMHGHHAMNGVYSLPVSAFRTLALDDIAGARALYGFAEDENCCGTINGKLLFGANKAVRELQVWLEEADTGRIVTGTLSDQLGAWKVEGVPAGDYFVYAQNVPDYSDAKNKALYSAERLGEINLAAGKAAKFEKAFTVRPRRLGVDLLGFNAQLSTLAVPVNAGKAYALFLADKTMPANMPNVVFNSPYLQMTSGTMRPMDFNDQLKAVTFEVRVAADTPPGEYSLRVENGKDVFYLVGALSVEPTVANDSTSTLSMAVNQ
jgi:hypothetical protein